HRPRPLTECSGRSLARPCRPPYPAPLHLRLGALPCPRLLPASPVCASSVTLRRLRPRAGAECGSSSPSSCWCSRASHLGSSARARGRAQTLRKDYLSADVDVENAQTAVEVLQAQSKAMRAGEQLASVNLENTRVRAPFDGTVLRKDAEVGEIVAPSSAGGGLT